MDRSQQFYLKGQLQGHTAMLAARHFANYYNTHIVLYQQALSHKFLYFFLDRALRHRRP